MSISTFKSNTYWMDVDLLLLGLQGHVTFENVSCFQGQLRHETKWMRIYLFSHGNISISGVDKDYRWHEGGWKPNVFPYASSSEPQDLATVPESSCPVDFLELMLLKYIVDESNLLCTSVSLIACRSALPFITPSIAIKHV